MKKLIQKEATFCDLCGKEDWAAYVCPWCGKDICFSCGRTDATVEMDKSIYRSDTVYYCKPCNIEATLAKDPLLHALQRLKELSDDQQARSDTFHKNREILESLIKDLEKQRKSA